MQLGVNGLRDKGDCPLIMLVVGTLAAPLCGLFVTILEGVAFAF